MMKIRWTATSAAACALVLSLEVIAIAGLYRPDVPSLTAPVQQVRSPPPAAQMVAQPLSDAPIVSVPVARDDSYYAQLRPKIRWVETRFAGDRLLTPDAQSRMLLAKSAAERAGLHEVGLSFKDVYGIINAETSWVPRMGASKDGTPNLGIAQFEPATARGLGLRDPNDPVESIHVAALHMKDAAEWSANRLAGLKLSAEDRAEKLREGVSIYYNLSSRGRSAWNGRNTAKLPRETQRHIENTRNGAQEAAWLDAQLQAQTYARTQGRPMTVAAASFQR